ncbi:hypothetical protein D9757_009064 [Collybiopsis confluens]|uniref:Uncharacterized protein n=1 Tax=Collybiopsis confluens TaxID=2823264 RepID=A0A8H5HDS0_9AGAR|nr:hypothetical protein D9757_009064 [Collybiopsis confluens]
MSGMKHLDYKYEPDGASLAALVRGATLQTLDAMTVNLSWSNFCQCDFSSLQELIISGLIGAPIGRFLDCMPSLENLKIRGPMTAAESDSPLRPSNLRHLTVSSEEDCPAGAWKSLWVPHLTSLGIRSREYSEGLVETISSCLCRSKTVLKALSITVHFDNEVLNFIRSQPSINELTVRCYSKNVSEDALSPEEMLSCLTISQDPEKTVLVPNLERLNLQIYYMDHSFQPLVLARDISEMVKSRAAVGDRPTSKAVLQALSLGALTENVEDLFNEIRILLAPLVASGFQLLLDGGW